MSLSVDIARFAALTEAKKDQFVRKVCLTLLSDVVLGTPVDTGRARGNWQASIGIPKSGVLEVTDRSGGGTITAGLPDIAKASGTIFWISNNLPYINRLEYEGWSKQQPHGWVRSAVTRISSITPQ